MTIMLAATAAALFGIGTYLLLQRKLSRIIVGLGLLTHGANILLITAGDRGNPPIIGGEEGSGFADPLPQALALTAIVITFAVTAFVLGIIYRSWVLGREDEVQDDPEDHRVRTDRGAYDHEDDAELAADTSDFLEQDDVVNSGSTAVRGTGL